jgi:hypothetical protein
MAPLASLAWAPLAPPLVVKSSQDLAPILLRLRFTAAQAGFFDLSQSGDRPEPVVRVLATPTPDCPDVVRTLIESGGQLIDTASTYGDAERVFGSVISARSPRLRR